MFEKENENHDNDRIVCSTGKARRRCDDGGAIKAEVGKLNVESKERREAKEKTARQEIEMTQSVWVKIRNRIYLLVIYSVTDNIIQTIQDGLTELSKK